MVTVGSDVYIVSVENVGEEYFVITACNGDSTVSAFYDDGIITVKDDRVMIDVEHWSDVLYELAYDKDNEFNVESTFEYLMLNGMSLMEYFQMILDV